AALAERYRRLSLLTLNLAEEAGAAAVNFSLVDTKGVRPAFFDRRPAREGAHSLDLAAFAARAMTRAIWAHRVIERLRGRPTAKAATLKCGAKAVREDDAWRAMKLTERCPDDGWTPRSRAKARFFNVRPPSRSSRGESDLASSADEQKDGVWIDTLGAAENPLNDRTDLSRYAQSLSNQSPTRHGSTMASMSAAGKNAADCAPTLEADLDDRWTPRPHTNAANPRSAAKAAARGAQSTRPFPDERWTPRSSRGESYVLGDEAERKAVNLSPTRHSLIMASMAASGENAADDTQSTEQRPDEKWTLRPAAKAAYKKDCAKARFFEVRPPLRPGRGESGAAIGGESDLASGADNRNGEHDAVNDGAATETLTSASQPSPLTKRVPVCAAGAAIERRVNDGRRAAPP
ncbi:MAG: hypothetical protein AAGJ73_16095, partial [Pseudomonadota bacterium]